MFSANINGNQTIMVEKGKNAAKRKSTVLQKGGPAPSPSAVNSEDQYWHSVNENNCPVRYRDRNDNLTGFRSLQPDDIILLLTPVVPPRPNTPEDEFGVDPYEYLSRALLARHQKVTYVHRRCMSEDLTTGNDGQQPSQDPEEELFETLKSQQGSGKGAVAHISYTNQNRITSTHRGCMRLSKFIIMVVNNNAEERHPHVDAFRVARAVNMEQNEEQQPHRKRGITLVLTNNSPGAFDVFDSFEESPTIIQAEDYSKRSLDTIAAIIFGEIGAGIESSEAASPTARAT